MKHRISLLISCLAFLHAPLLAQTPTENAAAQDAAPEETFSGQVEVTAVELRIDVRDRKGRMPSDLTLDDFEVLEDGKPMRLLGLDGGGRAAGESVPVAAVAAPPQETSETPELPSPDATQVAPGAGSDWRFLIYFDAPLSSPRSTSRSAATLAKQAEELIAMGPVEIVVANPIPKIVLPFSNDAEAIREALLSIKDVSWDGHEMSKIRRDFIRRRDMVFHGTSVNASQTTDLAGQIRSSVRTEYQLMKRQLVLYYDWVAAYGHLPGSVAMLVADGYDIEPSEFYLNVAALPGLNLGMELEQFRLTGVTEDLAEALAAHGWTNMIYATGAGAPALDAVADASMAYRDRFRSIAEDGDLSTGPSSNTVTSLMVRPLEPLQIYAGVTGGEVVTTPKKIVQSIDRLNERYRLTYLSERAADGSRHKVDVRVKRKGLKVQAPRWVTSPTRETVAESRARRLLVRPEEDGELNVDVEVGDETDEKGRRKLEVRFDLRLLSAAMPGQKVPMRFTLGVELADSTPFLHHAVQEVIVPKPPIAPKPPPTFLYQLLLAMPNNAREVSVIVEEPTTGIWGGDVIPLK